jgi:hypothetical protein
MVNVALVTKVRRGVAVARGRKRDGMLTRHRGEMSTKLPVLFSCSLCNVHPNHDNLFKESNAKCKFLSLLSSFSHSRRLEL